MGETENGQRRTRPGKEVALSEYQLAVGQRMKLAAQRAGYPTTQEMAAQTGVASGTISRWWRGVRRPSGADLELYAAAVGVAVEWLLTGITPGDAVAVEGILLRIVELVMAGEAMHEAFGTVTGYADQFGRRDRETLAEGAAAVRAKVTELAGSPWEQASPDQRRQAVARLHEAATRSRRR